MASELSLHSIRSQNQEVIPVASSILTTTQPKKRFVLIRVALFLYSLMQKLFCCKKNNLKNKKLFIHHTIIFNGSQRGHSGIVSLAGAESIRDKLDKQACSNIRFNKSKVVENLEGGTCTAMALEFLETFFKIRKECVGKDFAVKILAKLKINARQFLESSEEMRTRQAVFNTIEVMRSDVKEDDSRNKIQSLLNHHKLNIIHASKEIEVDNLRSKEEMSSILQELPEGAYVIRILKPSNNEKLEEKGHTMIYIKEQEFALFYDPNFGCHELLSADQHLYESFKENLRVFGINNARFYRVQDSVA